MECIKGIETGLGIDDCLACSGCVTVGEPNKEKHLAGLGMLGQNTLGVVITPQAKLALYERLCSAKPLEFAGTSFREFERALLWWFGASVVVDSSVGSQILLDREARQVFAQMGLGVPLISSMCPGVVAYAENTAHHLVEYLSTNRTPVEICAHYLKSQGRTVLSVVMCKDKRLEAEQDVLVEYCVTTNDLFDHLVSSPASFSLAQVPAAYAPHAYGLAQVLPGSSAGGVFEGILQRVEETEGRVLSRVEKENYKEASFMDNTQIRKVAQIHGLPRVISFSTKAKSKAFISQYAYVELMICKGACLHGPSQGTAVDAQVYFNLSVHASFPHTASKVCREEEQDLIQTISHDLSVTPKTFAKKMPSKKTFNVKW
ncbi:hypothetical protein NECID01_0926 [Nematocida sp. AWRm77]|nr:hypothetical protein NECID01_0926 [Nematocida sp. AWRm77]